MKYAPSTYHPENLISEIDSVFFTHFGCGLVKRLYSIAVCTGRKIKYDDFDDHDIRSG
ncbi:hypothetical protein SAMN02746095_02893 [Acidocella aminolytica 101 = DSM 11237]|nr:hypothetical protein SAMN02746095_02893 [Acidocella aminolytica 101 = DSM 11237]